MQTISFITRPIILSLFLLLVFLEPVCAQVSGVKTIPGDYNSITDAIQQISAVGVNGATYLELQQGYNSEAESYPIIIRNVPGASTTNTVTISPAAGVTGLIIIPNLFPNYTFQLIGASNIIIDGRPGRTGSSRELTIQNPYAYPAGPAIGIYDGSSNNVITYCILEGGTGIFNPMQASIGKGVVEIGRSSDPLQVNVIYENSNNTISNCLIRGLNHSIIGIYAYGSEFQDPPVVNNISTKIINNEVVNFESAGMWLIGQNSETLISGNSIYQPFNIGGTGIVVWGSPGNVNNSITGNFIGGQAANCGGAPWNSYNFSGIVVGNGPYFGELGSMTIENNIIRNIALTGNLNGLSRFIGIYLGDKLSSSVVGNFIGGTGPSDRISISDQNISFAGIDNESCNRVPITGNTISNINLNASVGNFPEPFYGIKSTRAYITGNVVDALSITSTGGFGFTAIKLIANNTCPFVNPFHDGIEYNLLKNITLSSTDGDASFTGVGISARLSSNTGNVIGSSTSSNSISVTGKNASATGIVIDDAADNVSISNDIISNITATGVLSSAVKGIHYKGTGTVLLARNSISRLSSTDNKGILIEPVSGSSTATLDSNTVTGTGFNSGTGVLTSITAAASLNLIAADNIITNWQTGFAVSSTTTGTFSQTLLSNTITGNQTGFNNQTNTIVNATCNWWGSASGPSGAGPGTGDPVGSNVIFTPWATIPQYVSVNAGIDKSIYIGYGPSSVTLTPTVIVCGTPAYLWSTGSTSSSITVSPTSTTNYSVTVKDADGHTATDDVLVKVTDIRCGNNKVLICHKESATKKKSVCISVNDVPMHLAHGDNLGSCITAAKGGIEFTMQSIPETGSALKLFPNPAVDQIELNWEARRAGVADIRIRNMLGQEVWQKKIAEKKEMNQIRISLKDLQKGSYILEINNGQIIKTKRFNVL